jgi:hypothetical protein
MRWLFAMISVTLAAVGVALGADGGQPAGKGSAFGMLKADAAETRKRAEEWLKSRRASADVMSRFNAAWDGPAPVLDKVTASLTLGEPAVEKLLADARDEAAPAPTALPELITKAPDGFFRSSLALAYGKALAGRKVYEEALEALSLVKPEEAADPATYFFHKAVCEHALMFQDAADRSLGRLTTGVEDVPERYRYVAQLLYFDMQTWQEKDLEWVARKMSGIQRRLALGRGGKQTQRLQKEVLIRLEEIMKQLQNPKGIGSPNDGDCPDGGEAEEKPVDRYVGMESVRPPKDTPPGGDISGTGAVDVKKMKAMAESWGKLPEKERADAIRELLRTMPAKDRGVVEAYFRELQRRSGK